MKIKAEQKNSRQSPRKVRLVANQIKDLSLEQAFIQLSLIERKASLVLLKVLRQAVANAANNYQLGVEDLAIEKIVVKTGPTYKRMRAVSRGRGHRILKRTCHVEVILVPKPEVKPEKKTPQDKDKNQAKDKAQPKTKKEASSSVKKTKLEGKKTTEQKTTADKQFKKESKPAPTKVKTEPKMGRQTDLQQPVTKVHRRKSGA